MFNTINRILKNKYAKYVKYCLIGLSVVALVALVQTWQNNRQTAGTPVVKLPPYQINEFSLKSVEGGEPLSLREITTINPQATVELEFSEPVDTTNIKVSAAPAIQLITTTLPQRTNVLVVRPAQSSNWQFNIEYKIKLEGIKSSKGSVFSDALIFSVIFKTPERGASTGF